MNYIGKIIKSLKTVFRFNEFKAIFDIDNEKVIRNLLTRLKKNEILLNLFYGIWALPNYDKFELACKIRRNAYISLETVLYKEGLIFQYYEDTMTLISNDSRNYQIDGKEYRFSKIKDNLLNNIVGIKKYNNYQIATPERALCDIVYLLPKIKIENLEKINKVRLKEILKFYPKITSFYISKILNAG